MKNSMVSLGARFLAILCALLMLVCMVSCGKQPGEESGVSNDDVSSSDVTSNPATDVVSDSNDSSTDGNSTATTSGNSSANKTTKATKATKTTTAPSRVQNDFAANTDAGKMPEADLKGYEFVIADTTRYGDYAVPEAGSSSQADAWWKMLNEVQSKLNCKITYNFYDPLSAVETISTKLLSGDKVADILVAPQFSMGSYITAGFLQDLKKVPHLNLNANYWYKPITDATTIAGKTYGIAGDYNNLYGKLCGFFYNKRLIKELGMTDPYDLVKQGKWTFDTFRSMALKATKDINRDGKMTAKDQYGIVGPWIFDPLYAANGSRKLTTDKNGKVVLGINTNQSIETLNWLRNLKYTDKVILDIGETVENMGDSNVWIKYFHQFIDGKALFLGTAVMDAQYIRDMEDDFGFVICPKGPNATSYSSFIEVNASMIGVFHNNKDLEKTGAVLEAMGYLGHYMSDAYLNEDVYLTLLRGDEHSMEMIDLCLNNVVFDIGEFEAIDNLIHTFRYVLRNETVDVKQKLESYAGEWTAQINKVFK